MEQVREKQDALFPDVKADSQADPWDTGRAATPAEAKRGTVEWIELLKIELSTRRTRRSSSRAEVRTAVSTATPNVNTSENLPPMNVPKIVTPPPPRTLSTSVGNAGRVPPAPNRRVSDESADFDATVGKWMHEAHSRLERQGVKSSRGRKTPDLPPAQYRKIVERTDEAKRNGKPRFPLKDVLSKKIWREIAENNRKAGVAKGKLSRWSDVAFLPQFKRDVRHRYNRAEIHYRKHFVPQQS